MASAGFQGSAIVANECWCLKRRLSVNSDTGLLSTAHGQRGKKGDRGVSTRTGDWPRATRVPPFTSHRTKAQLTSGQQPIGRSFPPPMALCRIDTCPHQPTHLSKSPTCHSLNTLSPGGRNKPLAWSDSRAALRASAGRLTSCTSDEKDSSIRSASCCEICR